MFKWSGPCCTCIYTVALFISATKVFYLISIKAMPGTRHCTATSKDKTLSDCVSVTDTSSKSSSGHHCPEFFQKKDTNCCNNAKENMSPDAPHNSSALSLVMRLCFAGLHTYVPLCTVLDSKRHSNCHQVCSMIAPFRGKP